MSEYKIGDVVVVNDYSPFAGVVGVIFSIKESINTAYLSRDECDDGVFFEGEKKPLDVEYGIFLGKEIHHVYGDNLVYYKSYQKNIFADLEKQEGRDGQ